MKGSDRVVLDSHPYLCFQDQDTSPLASQVHKPCQNWGGSFNGSLNNFGVTIAGEWSVSWNDCECLCSRGSANVDCTVVLNASFLTLRW